MRSSAANPGELADRLVGPAHYRTLVGGEEISDAYVDRLVVATLLASG